MFYLSGLACIVFILFVIVGGAHSRGGAHLKIFPLGEALFRGGGGGALLRKYGIRLNVKKTSLYTYSLYPNVVNA